jgi:hypothetical protein
MLKIKKHPEVFLKILAGTKGGQKEKQLASQFITRFFSHFPKEMALAIDAIFDLCEDEDVTVSSHRDSIHYSTFLDTLLP